MSLCFWFFLFVCFFFLFTLSMLLALILHLFQQIGGKFEEL